MEAIISTLSFSIPGFEIIKAVENIDKIEVEARSLGRGEITLLALGTQQLVRVGIHDILKNYLVLAKICISY